MRQKPHPDPALISANFTYDSETGLILWRVCGHRRVLGIQVGFQNPNGGRTVRFMRSCYAYSHLAWVLHYKEWPTQIVCHRNGDRWDFRISNLVLQRSLKGIPSSERDDLIQSGLSYNPETGHISRVIKNGESQRADTYIRNYRHVNFSSKHFLAHRLAWFLHYGTWPSEGIDHINHDGCDNRIENLRDVSQTENLRNSKRSKSNSSGCTGVSFSHKKWAAWIGVKSKRVCLGRFEVFEEAVEARKAAEEHFGYHKNHGEIRK